MRAAIKSNDSTPCLICNRVRCAKISRAMSDAICVDVFAKSAEIYLVNRLTTALSWRGGGV
jgi:hypothetical protein